MVFKEYNQDHLFPSPPSLHDFLPEGYLAHVINDVEDCYICLMGKSIPYKGFQKREGKPDIRIYKCMDCPECKPKWECTKAACKTSTLDPREFLVKMRIRLGTREGKTKYGKRKYMVDFVFGDMKQNRNI